MPGDLCRRRTESLRPALLILLWILAALRCGPADAAPTDRATIASADTVLTLEAGTQSPKILALTLRGANTWLNEGSDALPDHVDVRGADRPLRWHLQRNACHFGIRLAELVYVSDAPRLRLLWQWRARSGHGPLEHTITIQNLGDEPVWLPLVPSLRFNWQVDAQLPLQRFWVEKGADIPSPEGTHADALHDGDSWEGTSSSYARPRAGQAREMIPYLLVHQADADQRGWYLGIEFSGRTHITLQRLGSSLVGEAGLNPLPGPYRTRLLPQQSFVTPTIFLGASRGGPDGAGNVLRRWVRAVLNNPHTLRNPAYPLLVDNSWGHGMAVDEPLAQRMIAESRDLGLEMFHLDAGWFRGVGDWQADPAKFPHGIAAIADDAHRSHLKFGLWVDWAQAGTGTQAGALNVYEPTTRDWLVADPPQAWRHSEPFKGITIDLGVPAARQWAAREIERLVSEDRLDMLEHDGYLVAQGSSRDGHPAAPPEPSTLRVYEDSGFLWAEGSNDTDVSYYATRAYYTIYEQVRRHHPRLLLEVCNDGGRMVDFGSAAHGDYFSISDTYDPLSNRRAFYDASYVLPPAMLETYVDAWPTPSIENLRYLLRSGMLGWFSLMLDASRWTPEQRVVARSEFALYKSALRPLIRAADLYHVAERPDGVHWDGMEYYSPALQRGVLYAFRGTAPDAPSHRFRLQGLDPRQRYRLRFQDRGGDARLSMSGQALMQEGIEVRLPEPLSSELVFIARGQ